MTASGVVLRHEGRCVVVDLGGEEVACTLRKTLKRARGSKAVAVGDRVTVEREGEVGAVTGVEERRSELARPDPSRPRHKQVIAANVDLLLVVASAAEPSPVTGLIDRFLVAGAHMGIETALLLNKVDLDPGQTRAEFRDAYAEAGLRVLETSAVARTGLEELKALLTGRTTTLAGHSGVGKSSLANALDPSLRIRTAEVQERSGKGVHTTTTASLLRLPWGGYLVDTPGIREFGLWGMEARDLGACFPEIAARASSCRFQDCLHDKEPECAVKEACGASDFPEWRYASYRTLLDEIRARDRGG
ncbi:MAG: ribosome small subunit-dependent GTPase A [Planctomycetaceae bacterium]